MSKSKNPLHKYVKYSSLALQMGAIIFAGAYGGVKLDEYLELGFPAFTIGLTIISVVIAVYFSIKDLLKDNSKK